MGVDPRPQKVWGRMYQDPPSTLNRGYRPLIVVLRPVYKVFGRFMKRLALARDCHSANSAPPTTPEPQPNGNNEDKHNLPETRGP